MSTVAALYVETGGVYSALEGVDLWDAKRDARRYLGPHPVVAHPPCKRWGRYWHGGPSARERKVKGDDGGCFKCALTDVRTWGGVLEHPEASHAWAACGLSRPKRGEGWVRADRWGGFACYVEQGHYGHRARKGTWLYAFGVVLPELVWGPSVGERLDDGYHSKKERAAAVAAGQHQPRKRLSKAECLGTPKAFAETLVEMARSALGPTARTLYVDDPAA